MLVAENVREWRFCQNLLAAVRLSKTLAELISFLNDVVLLPKTKGNNFSTGYESWRRHFFLRQLMPSEQIFY